MNIEISLTDFVEFILKTGSPKLTKVKQIKDRPAYHPNKDYWKILRDKIESCHREEGNLTGLKDVLNSIQNQSKEIRYQIIIDNYKDFFKNKSFKWFSPPYTTWNNSDLYIRLNPELGLEINKENYVIKLYFSSEKLSKSKIDLILTLLKNEFRDFNPTCKFAVFDIKTKKLYTDENINSKKLLPLLIGEAYSFEHIWKNI